MEPKFDLQKSADKYVVLIQNQGSITSSDAEELKSHLFDSTAELVKTGLSEEEAFTIACKRLGNGELLTEEYGKVNVSVRTNKIWAYLLIGYNLFYKIPSLLFLPIGFFYILIYENYHNKKTFETSISGVAFVVLFHLLFIAIMWALVKNKDSIAKFIQKQVEENTIRAVCISFIPFVFLIIAKPMFHIPVGKLGEALSELPMRKFQSGLIEFSFYLSVLSIVGSVLSLVFSMNLSEKLSIKSLFEKPSAWFLLLFGVFIEMMASTTRVIRFPFDTKLMQSGEISYWVTGPLNKIASVALFGIVYLLGTFLIVHYNKFNRVTRYILIFSSFGFIMEIIVGIQADLDRAQSVYGHTYYTIYYVSAMLIGILLGKLLAQKSSDQGFIALT